MNLFFTDNVTSKLLDILRPQVATAKDVKVAVAFAKYSGFALIWNVLNNCLQNGGKAEFVLGLDFRTTDAEVVKKLLDLRQEGLNVACFCFSDPTLGEAPMYHPKMYLIAGPKNIFVALGSSNLTAGGLRDNVEANVVIEGNLGDEPISDIHSVYNRIKLQPSLFEPDMEYVEEYAEACRAVRRGSAERLGGKTALSKVQVLREREKTLPKPTVSSAELVGWQKLVYQRLPAGVFRTSDMYEYAHDFAEHYPENRHIPDKIRQILQQLRDLNLVRHVSMERWEKA